MSLIPFSISPSAAVWRAASAAAFAAALTFSLSGCGKGDGPPGGGHPSAPTVSAAPAAQRAVADREEFSGRLEATDFVELRPRVAGTIDKVYFTDGASVKKGDLLFLIDPRPFQAEAARAQSQLDAVKAREQLALSEVARAQKLVDSQAVSRQEFDQLGATARSATADLQAAAAALRTAQLNLGFTQVRAPISGRASRANITAGNLVNEQSVLTSIAGVSRMYAYFDGSESTFLRLRADRTAGGQGQKVKMGLVNETGYPHEGRIDFVDNRLNPQTGAIRLRASFDNASGQFTPGLAARLLVENTGTQNRVLVPDRAIGTDQTKKFVYVVQPGAVAPPQQREVKPGALVDGMRIVEGNLKAGELIVVDGLQRIVPGVPVQAQVLQVDARGMPVTPAPGAGGPGGGAPAAGGASSPASAASAPAKN